MSILNSKQYIKRPVQIEAVILTPDNLQEVGSWLGIFTTHSDGLEIHTLEGKMLARYGDYIIKGIEGEFYPCNPSIFVRSYQELG